jgi:hypothetical protein
MLTRPYATYNASYKIDKDILLAERRLVTRADELPAAVAEDYSDFRKRVLADEVESMFLPTLPSATDAKQTEQH